jgi:hypothetical protein
VPDVGSLRRIKLVEILSGIGIPGNQRYIRWRPPYEDSKNLASIEVCGVLPSQFSGRWRNDGTLLMGVRKAAPFTAASCGPPP